MDTAAAAAVVMTSSKSSKTSTSIRIFRSYIIRVHHADGTISLDASNIVSRECYQEWLRFKFTEDSEDESLKFWRSLTNTISGTDGRTPFERDEEAAVLLVLRRREPWPCFPPNLSHIGSRYRAQGYHEKQRIKQRASAGTTMDSSLAPPAASSIREQNARELLDLMDPKDATYWSQLCSSLVSGILQQAEKLTEEEYTHVGEILRYTLLGKTERCRKFAPLSTAMDLCAKYSSSSPELFVVIYDLTASQCSERMLAQNDTSLGNGFKLVDGHGNRYVHRGDVFRILLAIGGAYMQPGVEFTVKQQEASYGGENSMFDVTYVVDLESYFLVTCAARV